MLLFHTKSLKSGCYSSRFRLTTLQILHSPSVAHGDPIGQCKPWAIYSRGSFVAFYDSVESLSLALPFTFTPTLIPYRSKQLRCWPSPCLGRKPCRLSLGWVLPLVHAPVFSFSPWSVLGALEGEGRISQRFHLCTGLGERAEAEKCEEFSLKQKLCLALGPPTRPPQRRARSCRLGT